MESFFLAETLKYLYLIFDQDNFMHNVGESAKVIENAGGGFCTVQGKALKKVQKSNFTRRWLYFQHRSPSTRSRCDLLLLRRARI